MTGVTSIRFRPLAVAIAIAGLVYSLGVCPAGCLKCNQWYAGFQHLIGHTDHLSQHTQEEHESHECDTQRDRAVLVSSRVLDLTGTAGAFLPSPLPELVTVPQLQPARGPTGVLGPPEHLLTQTLRAQRQLFRC